MTSRIDGHWTTVRGWGGGAAARVLLARPDHLGAVAALVAESQRTHQAGGPVGVIARGMGRSYGDAAQLAGGMVLDLTGLKGTELHAGSSSLTARAGVSVAELLGELGPAGWMLPVVPGTQHVTVGGAIASDVHGKNHASAGTFGANVQAIGLMTSSGEVLELSPRRHPELFQATIGGMGLTGLILWARLDLVRPDGPLLTVDTDRVESLDAAFAALSSAGGPYRIAWLDLLNRGRVRGIVTRARHAPGGAGASGGVLTRPRARVPAGWPGGKALPGAVRLANELRFRRAPRRERERLAPLGPQLFPLDWLEAWPRLYGRQGMLQYQCVIPAGSEGVMHTMIERLQLSGLPCLLATLKDLGPAHAAPLSFPLAGWTLALDFPRAAPGLESLLGGFDELVVSAGGRVYLTKDDRLRAEIVEAMYPRLKLWRGVREQHDPERLWCSSLSLRTHLI